MSIPRLRRTMGKRPFALPRPSGVSGRGPSPGACARLPGYSGCPALANPDCVEPGARRNPRAEPAIPGPTRSSAGSASGGEPRQGNGHDNGLCARRAAAVLIVAVAIGAVGGQAKDMEESFRAALAALGLAVILIYLILASQFARFT